MWELSESGPLAGWSRVAYIVWSKVSVAHILNIVLSEAFPWCIYSRPSTAVYEQKRPAGILSRRPGRCGPPAGAALRSPPPLCPKAFWARVPGEATPDPYFFFFFKQWLLFYLANKFQGFQLMFTSFHQCNYVFPTSFFRFHEFPSGERTLNWESAWVLVLSVIN